MSWAVRGRLPPADQVHLRGDLADYKHADWKDCRRSSVVRTDAGNGASETVYLVEFEILKRANPVWRFLFRSARVGPPGSVAGGSPSIDGRHVGNRGLWRPAQAAAGL